MIIEQFMQEVVVLSVFILSALVWAGAAAGDAQFVAAILDDEKFVCAGAILSEKWIVTAGHCVKLLKPKDIKVVVGTTDYTKPGQTLKVASIEEHPKFADITSFNYDIALLKLASDIKLDDKTRKIDLTGSDIKSKEQLQITGWKRAKDTNLKSLKSEAIKDNNDCDQLSEDVADNLFCLAKSQKETYGELGSRDLQGGPIVGAENKLDGIIYKLVKPKQIVGLAMRLNNFSKWIKETMQKK
ncbi:mite allergen Der f 3-like [Pieris napi]|uniref:mite allergen Der f 3-like n=1 Tax=Pieris napi TaxID=78633 RepID=UPI001FB9BD3B|nr:mite allergen Der f 3-like [Pieris napi]